MAATRECNYLSVQYQLSMLMNIFNIVVPTLENYIQLNRGDVQSGLLLNQLPANASQKQCVRTLLETFDRITENCQRAIVENNSEEQKEDSFIPQYNNQHLLTYFKALEGIFTFAKTKLKALDARLICTLEKWIETCQQNKKYLQHAADISIYKVVLPEEKYKEMYAQSERFHYEGRAIATAKTVGGTIATPIAAGIGFFAVTLSLVGSIYSKGQKTIAEIDKISRVATVPGKKVGEGISRYGYSCKALIPSEWIACRIDEVKDDGTLVEGILNPKFISYDTTVKTRVIFILDAKDPEQVMLKGIFYKDIGESGNTIYFHNPIDAARCAKDLADGKKFDYEAGFRRYHEWTDAERAEIPAYVSQTKAALGTRFPNTLVEVVGDYLAFDPTPASVPQPRSSGR